ncbi:hypothetical protein [Peribacillus loiseleuriae]|uniref:Uncharacterized protein n=1 Tax=Peribacillus loiseleuriae TaxID=1679170 RepID=A0A0K9GSN8_9BACI|nr:hypothetical protein [Peribacillus loiseleuriae]KMY49650.1 hypothetical protein AC625_08945 [Peribacillus loiseleuriae]
MLKNNLSWSESILHSFTYDSLSNIYQYILDRKKVYKAKASFSSRFSISLHLPKELRASKGLSNGDKCNSKFNIHKKKVYLDFTVNGTYDIYPTGKIVLPYALVEKGLMKAKDDSMLFCENGRITVKSFSVMQ